jgi:hypothetical protein
MSLLRSQLIAEVYEYCGNPDDRPLKDGGLPQQFVFQVLTENEDEMLRDLELSNQGRRIAKQEVSLSTDEFEFSLNADAAAPAYVGLRTDPSSNVWYPVEIVTPDALLQASANGVMAITFRGLQAEVSWQPDSSHNLVVYYERSGDDNPQLFASTDLGNLYDSYLKLRTAAQCRELLSLKVGEVLATRLARSEQQWQRYARRGNQRGLAAKTRVFNPRGLRYPFLDRTRFFVS